MGTNPSKKNPDPRTEKPRAVSRKQRLPEFGFRLYAYQEGKLQQLERTDQLSSWSEINRRIHVLQLLHPTTTYAAMYLENERRQYTTIFTPFNAR